MTWNYRVIATKLGEETIYGIYEVYYDAKGKPNARTQRAIDIDEHSSVEEIRWTLARMLEATDKPVLTDEDFE